MVHNSKINLWYSKMKLQKSKKLIWKMIKLNNWIVLLLFNLINHYFPISTNNYHFALIFCATISSPNWVQKKCGWQLPIKNQFFMGFFPTFLALFSCWKMEKNTWFSNAFWCFCSFAMAVQCFSVTNVPGKCARQPESFFWAK